MYGNNGIDIPMSHLRRQHRNGSTYVSSPLNVVPRRCSNIGPPDRAISLHRAVEISNGESSLLEWRYVVIVINPWTSQD